MNDWNEKQSWFVPMLEGASPEAQERVLVAAIRVNEARENRREWKLIAMAGVLLGLLAGLVTAGTISLVTGASEKLTQCDADRAALERIAELAKVAE